MLIRPPERRSVSVQRLKKGFTLLEIMIVVALIGIVMAMGIPSFTRIRQREGMQRGVADFFEACRQVRANAIISGQPAELVIHPKSKRFEVTGPTPYSGQFPDNVWIELLGVNFVEMQNADDAHVKFQPNATCDECTMILMSTDQSGQHGRKITFEVVTGLVDVEDIK